MTSPLVLRTAIGNYPYVKLLKDGSITSPRLTLEFIEVEPLNEAFRRMLRDWEFDVCEMALTTHALAHAFDKPITALPVILHRNFHHAALLCAPDSKLRGVEELAGKRVGVRAYSQTTGVWVRGIMASEYGLDLDRITWVTVEDAHVKEYQDPSNVERAAPGKGLKTMLASGEIDAAIGIRNAKPGEVRTVIPEANKAAAAWFRKTGIYPANHAVSVRNDLLATHPWLANELMTLFERAKAKARAQGIAKQASFPVAADQTWLTDLVGDDPHPYGLAANRKPIEMVIAFSAQQKLIPRAYTIEELFDVRATAA